MMAQEYLALKHPTCEFIPRQQMGASVATVAFDDKPCGRLAVAVYVTADHRQHGTYVCREHAEFAEESADGPVFWKRFVPPTSEESE